MTTGQGKELDLDAKRSESRSVVIQHQNSTEERIFAYWFARSLDAGHLTLGSTLPKPSATNFPPTYDH